MSSFRLYFLHCDRNYHKKETVFIFCTLGAEFWLEHGSHRYKINSPALRLKYSNWKVPQRTGWKLKILLCIETTAFEIEKKLKLQASK
jgi:hypothetical protein